MLRNMGNILLLEHFCLVVWIPGFPPGDLGSSHSGIFCGMVVQSLARRCWVRIFGLAPFCGHAIPVSEWIFSQSEDKH